jgi:serine/threonine protein kinase
MDEQAVFIEALEKEDAAERAAFLNQLDPALRQRVEKLLYRHQQEDSFLKSPALDWIAPADAALSERPGTVIGSYKLMEQIGEGGFGIVFKAKQQETIQRVVALKVIKPGMDTSEVIARFEGERQALARMDHPNIAHVFDGGATESGRPYFVMELVTGISITKYCDQEHLTPRERLGLFVSVCQAVQHAHQKGIIHRDLKPTNILVAMLDGKPTVKVIDFGIAKAIGEKLTDETLSTVGQVLGTPLYMSPEQAVPGGDVDTRSDIYSLGVVLYELLVSVPPFDSERLRQANSDEMWRIIREEEPPRPSARISTMGQAATTAATNRKSDPRRLNVLLRGELDWVVMKCLEKDRNRRYATASELAQDVERYLHDEPVQGPPPPPLVSIREDRPKAQRSDWCDPGGPARPVHVRLRGPVLPAGYRPGLPPTSPRGRRKENPRGQKPEAQRKRDGSAPSATAPAPGTDDRVAGRCMATGTRGGTDPTRRGRARPCCFYPGWPGRPAREGDREQKRRRDLCGL